MTRASPRFTSYERNTSVVRVTSYERKRLAGTLYSPYLDRELRFENLMQFLLQMEELLDQADFPQRGTEPRRFEPETVRGWSPPPPGMLGSALATFKVSVLFRQNASWQGSVFWLDKKMESPFRSVLELVGLLDGALEESKE